MTLQLKLWGSNCGLFEIFTSQNPTSLLNGTPDRNKTYNTDSTNTSFSSYTNKKSQPYQILFLVLLSLTSIDMYFNAGFPSRDKAGMPQHEQAESQCHSRTEDKLVQYCYMVVILQIVLMWWWVFIHKQGFRFCCTLKILNAFLIIQFIQLQ